MGYDAELAGLISQDVLAVLYTVIFIGALIMRFGVRESAADELRASWRRGTGGVDCAHCRTEGFCARKPCCDTGVSLHRLSC